MKLILILLISLFNMNISQKLIIGWVSFPERALAKTVATLLVKHKFAACVKIIDGVESIYEWENKIQEANEYYLMIKTSDSKINEINNLLKSSHPHQTYEFIYTNIDGGNENYLNWIKTTIHDLKSDL